MAQNDFFQLSAFLGMLLGWLNGSFQPQDIWRQSASIVKTISTEKPDWVKRTGNRVVTGS